MPEGGDLPLRGQADWPRGTILRIEHRSRVLEGNPWGDPVARDLFVYLPPGYREDADPYPALWDFAAFSNAGPGHLNWRGHGENLAQRLDRLIHEERMRPVVAVLPDCYTSLGGNQYLDSAAVGAYASYVIDELVPEVSRRVNVVDDRGGRAVFGTSSGGYGALWHAMHHPDTWGAAAAHAADCGFDWVYRPALPTACRVLAAFGGDPVRFIRAFWSARRPTGDDHTTLMVLAMAASYDADETQPTRIRLPMDLETCSLDEARWQRWLEHDPLTLVEDHQEALRSLRGLWLDAGSRDEYNIQFGVRKLHQRLVNFDIDHQFEEFDGGHRGLDWRLDHSLPFLAECLDGPKAR